MRTRHLIPALTVLLAMTAPGEPDARNLPAGLPRPLTACSKAVSPVRKVLHVINGDTIELEDGSLVRLVGALPPYRLRAFEDASPKGRLRQWSASTDINASENMAGQGTVLARQIKELRRLLTGRSVRLAYGDRRYDRYGRLLAQLVVLPGRPAREAQPSRPASIVATENASGTSPKAIWVQAYLIRHGFARAYGVPGHSHCLAYLTKLETFAIRARSGLWQLPFFRIRNSAYPEIMKRDVGSYQIVEGRVKSARRYRQRAYLNFGKNWRRDFTVGIKNRNLSAALPTGLSLRSLAGKLVRVHGWIDWRGGPFMDISMSGQIELIDE